MAEEENKRVTAGWFEIPVTDMARAMAFYESVFDCKLKKMSLGPLEMALFPWDESGKGAGGALVLHREFYKPSHEGVLIYFSSADAAIELARIEEAGGEVLQDKKEISPDVGFMGLFVDTEGNRVAVHSRK